MQKWEEGNTKDTIILSEESENTKLDDPLIILVTRVNIANTADQDEFLHSTQLDIQETETYTSVMQGPNTAESVRAIEEELD